MYKATIYYDVVEDDYEEGEIGEPRRYREEGYTAETTGELRQLVLDATFQNNMDGVDDEQTGDYDLATEYRTTYLADYDALYPDALYPGVYYKAAPKDIERWKRGDFRLWAVHCHILVSEITETKAVL